MALPEEPFSRDLSAIFFFPLTVWTGAVIIIIFPSVDNGLGTQTTMKSRLYYIHYVELGYKT